MSDTTFYRMLVAVETDATRYYGPDATRPGVLGERDSEQLLSHLAADLKALLPEVASCSLITAGVLLDQTQVLRPGYPVFEALEDVCLDLGEEGFRPGLVSIGAREGLLPVKALQPDPDIPPGLLQLLPVVLHGPAGQVEALGQAMEYRFLEEGQLSPHSANWLQSAFDVTVQHARMMTLTDLRAMLRLQLDHFGFLALWDLLDAALAEREETLVVESAHGIPFEWRDGAVHAPFQSFDYWANRGAGASRPAGRRALAESYAEWTREVRQYLTTLNAHAVPVRFFHPESGELLRGTWFSEAGPPASDKSVCVTEHSFGELGTLAVSVVEDGAVRHYYPLKPAGLNDIHAHIQQVIPHGHTVAFPGDLVYDEDSRKLVADCNEEPTRC